MSARALNRICFPLFLAAILSSVVLGLIAIWFSIEDETYYRFLGSLLVITVASAFIISVTRALNNGKKRNSTASSVESEKQI